MIVLTEIAQKLENILNHQDYEFTQENPTGYYFQVETQGYHLDRIADKRVHKNIIPVFIGKIGGSYNPVPDLKQQELTVPISFYFPVRMKDNFDILQGFLESAFVGKILNYGTLTKKALSNISPNQYGEVEAQSFDSFKSWIEETFELPVDRTEQYMAMSVNLYLSVVGEEYIWANEITATLSFTKNTETYTDNPTFAEGSIQSQANTQGEQELGANEGTALPFGVAYSSGFTVYVKGNTFYKTLVDDWCGGNAQGIVIDLTISLPTLDTTFTRKCYVESVNLPIKKGSLLTITFTFGTKTEDDEE